MLAILTSHPIQYQAPLWQALAADGRVPFEVWFVMEHGARVSHDREFGKSFKWDIPTLEGYPHRFLDADPRATPSSFFKARLREDLAQRLRRAGAKALWMQGWQIAAYWQAAWAAKCTGAELWLRGESNDLRPTASWKRPAKHLLLSRLFARVDRFLCVGRANRRLYESYGVPVDRLCSAPYGIDNARFETQAAEIASLRTALRRSWSIADEAFCVLFCGKFIAKKRPMDLVRAASLLTRRDARAQIHLLFAGSGELGAELRSHCGVLHDAEAAQGQVTGSADHASRPRATFAGFLNQTEISKAYVAADCLVLPSDSGETWGLVVNEAMASGLPCIASRACGVTEDLVLPFHPERSFPCGDAAALADAIALLRSRGASPDEERAHVAGHSLQVTLEQVVRLYHRAAAGQS